MIRYQDVIFIIIIKMRILWCVRQNSRNDSHDWRYSLKVGSSSTSWGKVYIESTTLVWTCATKTGECIMVFNLIYYYFKTILSKILLLIKKKKKVKFHWRKERGWRRLWTVPFQKIHIQKWDKKTKKINKRHQRMPPGHSSNSYALWLEK